MAGHHRVHPIKEFDGINDLIENYQGKLIRNKNATLPFDDYSESDDATPRTLRKKGKTGKKKRTTRLSELSYYHQLTYKDIIIDFAFSRKARQLAVPFICMGILLSFLLETWPFQAPQYNSPIILATAASISYENFPEQTIRPQLVLSLLFFFSLAMDFFFILAYRAC